MTETTENVTVGSSRTGRRAAPALDISAIIKDPTARIVVCCGAGGVGKTTTAASLALRAAEEGRRVVVLTIDRPVASHRPWVWPNSTTLRSR